MTDYASLEAGRWARMHVNEGSVAEFDSVAKRLCAPAAKARYQAISSQTGVPWWVIAVIHEREADQRWDRSLAQGDPINRKSVHTPAGRGPFATFEAAAFDALVNCAPYTARNKDWSAGGTLLALEKYNGMGYVNRGVPSPYLWAGSNQYSKGKYIRDRVYDPNAVDQQPGCAPLLARMALMDSSVTLRAPKPPAAPAVVAGSAAAATVSVAASTGHHWVAIAILVALALGGAYLLYRKFKK